MAKKKIPHVDLNDIEQHCLQHSSSSDSTLFAEAFSSIQTMPPTAKKEQKVKKSKTSYHVIAHDIYESQERVIYKTRLHAETMRFERKLDMHGMRVNTAYMALLPFIQQSYCSHVHAVLVITGKGKNSINNISVLNEAVLSWIQEYPLSEVIETYGIPHRKFGGEGAIGIILRPFNKNNTIRWNIHSLSSYRW